MQNISDQEKELFQQQMAGVTPLKKQPTLTSQNNVVPPYPIKQPSFTHHLAAKTTHLSIHVDKLSAEDADAPLLFFRAHVGYQIFKKLKKANYHESCTLDLHGMTIDDARQLLCEFIQQKSLCFRFLLIIHGKGHHSTMGQGVLKQYVNQWLKETSSVLAFCSAQPSHGGTGAVCICVKKNC